MVRALTVTADTNILVSALEFGGRPRRFLELAESGTVRLAVSDAILSEAERVLCEKFGWTAERWSAAQSYLREFAVHAEPERQIVAVIDDPDDDKILECAVAAECPFIVSGDKHLLRLRRFEGIQILTLAEFMERFGL